MAPPRSDTDNYRQLFLDAVPLMDVRAPIEFDKGAFPTAINLPLMTDHEREQVGIAYKNEGQDAAIRLGHEFVGGEIKAARVRQWLAFAEAHPEGYLYCFRGGLRSQIVQSWLAEAGIPYPRVEGGYKALRRFLIDETERLASSEDFIVIAGRTGSGKTALLNALAKSLDLEGAANHRGSSFGRRPGDQPSQINFENSIAVRLLKICDRLPGPVFIEDESLRVGQRTVPLPLANRMTKWPMVMVEEPLQSRIDTIHHDYVTGLLAEFQDLDGEKGFDLFADFLTGALLRIRKRLGGVRFEHINALLQAALKEHASVGTTVGHRQWIKALLTDYYDPMYDYQLSLKDQPVLFRGSRAEILAWHKDKAPAAVG